MTSLRNRLAALVTPVMAVALNHQCGTGFASGSVQEKGYIIMMTRYARYASAFALTLAIVACSREATPPSPRNESPVMAPAAGQSAPGGSTLYPRCAENFSAFDDNGDGRVSQDEFNARPHDNPDPVGVFRSRDHDGDGSLTGSEFCSGWRGASGPADASGPGMGFGAGMGPGRANGMGHRRAGGPMMGMRCVQHFDAFDADHNGKLTKDEFAAWPHVRGDAETLFVERDRDHDGVITLDEFCSP
jgi:Ca2+-binding EF-hand superfamily protein